MTRGDRGYQEGTRPRKAAAWFVAIALAIVVAALIAMLLRDRRQSVWTSIGTQPAIAISGLARIDEGNGLELLVVHDNRLPGEVRLSRLRAEDASHEPVAWPGDELPIDLEAVSPIPGRPGLFLTTTSGGDAALLQLTGEGADLLGAFTLPDRPERPQFEGLSVQRLADTLVAAWGDRGAGIQPGRIYWGVLDLDSPGLTVAGAVDMRAPYPPPASATTRHISDLRIARDGRLWLSSASDPGDRGPFESAVYEAGRLVVDGGTIRFEPSPSPAPVQTYRRKIEAIELTADESQLVVGTDDEASGGAIAMLPLARAAQAAPTPPPIGVVDLGNSVYQLTGGSNAVLAVGRDAAILVDTKFRNPQALADAVATVTMLPVRFVVNTHSHPDHTGGNELFAQRGATIVATAGAAEWMARPFDAPNGNVDPPLPEAGRPRETFSGRRTVAVDGQQAVVIEAPRSHSASDAYVHLPAANVIVMGDLHHSNEYPVYDATMGCRCGSYEGNLQAYEAMLALADDNTTFIPGHGGVTNKAEVTAYVSMLRRIRDRVTALVAEGRTADEVVAMKLLADDRSPTSPGPDNRDAFIRVLYTALSGGPGR